MSIRTFLPGLLLLAALPVFAQAQAPVAETRVAAVADAATTADAAVDRTCLRSTGTRIRPRATGTSRGRCSSFFSGRVYSQEDLRSTGEVDIAQALRMLDPSIR